MPPGPPAGGPPVVVLPPVPAGPLLVVRHVRCLPGFAPDEAGACRRFDDPVIVCRPLPGSASPCGVLPPSPTPYGLGPAMRLNY
ncbi:hypothetical protein [Methylobacterium oryzihabitans]|uniref:Uncharacterized protein n=1 Tax=Methylobacterium oryzihabitans TaxID=2499852 RepID=A0A437NRE6_9HYPH|nr:hypothetical protein [Methylobacterium oryzihabitans]RVU12564.1 hypothetical protein EOE48_27515 [Methylobacterium oryzihabitans]